MCCIWLCICECCLRVGLQILYQAMYKHICQSASLCIMHIWIFTYTSHRHKKRKGENGVYLYISVHLCLQTHTCILQYLCRCIPDTWTRVCSSHHVVLPATYISSCMLVRPHTAEIHLFVILKIDPEFNGWFRHHGTFFQWNVGKARRKGMGRMEREVMVHKLEM